MSGAENTSKINVTRHRRYATVVLPYAAQPEAAESCQEEVADLIASPVNAVVSCAAVTGAPKEWLELIRFLNKSLKRSGKKMRLIHVPQKMMRELEVDGKDLLEISLSTLSEALDYFESEDGTVGSNHFIKAFVHATLRALYIQCQTMCKQGRVYVKAEEQNLLLGDISGTIEVVGKRYSYALSISFPQKTFLSIMSRMLDKEYNELTKEIQDGAAELINIIYGQARLVLNEKRSTFQAKLPRVVLGRDLDGLTFGSKDKVKLDTGKTVVIPFESEFGTFFIEVWFPASFSYKMLFAAG